MKVFVIVQASTLGISASVQGIPECGDCSDSPMEACTQRRVSRCREEVGGL